jgi:hypothetical protein
VWQLAGPDGIDVSNPVPSVHVVLRSADRGHGVNLQ